MVDAIVTVVLKRLAQMIETRVSEEVCMLIDPTDEAEKLALKLKMIQEVLCDAERKGVTDPKVKRWLDKLQDISYDIDDVLDEWDWKNIKLQMEESNDASQSFWQKVSSSLKSVYLCSTKGFERRMMNLNIKKLNKRLELIGKQNGDEFNFIINLSRDNSQGFKRVTTTSFVDVSEVHGRDNDKEILMSKLLSEGSSQMENGVPVFSIVGVGGIGKTTLAQLVFNDEKIKNHFQERLWVCVSDPFDEIKVAKAILEELNRKTPDLSQFQTLLRCIEQAISGKNFLLVLDDVWTEDCDMWKPLRLSLDKGDPRSRILVTTRKMKVGQVIDHTQVQSLNPLSDSDCWNLFSQIAFHDRTEWEHEILEKTGRAIVEKCRGLPLAAKTIGGLLRFKSSWKEWQEVLESQVWELETAKTKIFPILVLSYNELHPIAKRCFSYCATFPKDEKIQVDTLIRIWCAQGFISSIGNSDDMEVKGREIFDNLAMRSFFQDFEKDHMGSHIAYCKMHDIMHDFAQFLTENECLIVGKIDGVAKLVYGQTARHVNLPIDKDKAAINAISILHEKCRSFVARRFVIPPNLLGHLKRVRVLILDHCELEVIPREIRSCIHLRYLDLSWNPIKELRETICDLYNLQTLKLHHCKNLSRLPQGIHKLRNLRHLQNFNTPKLEFLDGIEELTNLWTLSEINVSRRNWKSLRVLRNLNHLRGSLRINIEGSDDADDLIEEAEKASLKDKNLVQKLMLSYEGKVPFQVMEALQPPPNLQFLKFEGRYLPKWVTTLTQLRVLDIKGTSYGLGSHLEMVNFSSLPALGKLPFLQHLSLCELYGMERLSREFLGIDASRPTANAFPRLKGLVFWGCWEWKEWEDISEEEENNVNISVFPSLQELSFHYCRKLEGLPHRLLHKASSLKHLIMYQSNNLRKSYGDWERSLKNPQTHTQLNHWSENNI